MSLKVTVVDYGIGNVFSVVKALEHCGADVLLTGDAEAIRTADRLVLPGVGAFADGMNELSTRGLLAPIHSFCAGGRPFMGVCLGMQMMLETSEEFGNHSGLSLIAGAVRAIENTASDGRPHRIPHIGWNRLQPATDTAWTSPIFQGVDPGEWVYFVHSFKACPAKAEEMLAVCHYNGRTVGAVIGKDNMFGFQFHPEKSGETGLKFLRNFLRI
ncbi:imidazole glycerol phosphate synthase subunit HisH [Kamptonema cortianum]|nr:imidazole glycerol phosphate synthase subunit HisH [Oscillatoria laete-virens]MDK3155387.1 imidazole glycerol phosphate synthase subunit HisH [Kamptonema cortianum]MDL5046136.1 imidazole glycerol phosphate synthase subunit HisH [Oscillatoria amoena NRMC-F 0135]MDL5052835.1 imidazole glycerol phosphate synthase subunit HisH [Oscillatoria laete-virens NRMC-F 0139]